MENNEELVVNTDTTENVVEQATEELVDGNNTTEDVTENQSPEEKLYTESEFNQKLDEVIPKKIARREEKIRKEYERKLKDYEYAEQVLNAGMGTSNIKEAINNLKEFYTQKGIEIPQYQDRPNQYDMEAGAEKEAQAIIDSGYEDIIEETDRLASIGVDKMTPRDKIMFKKLAVERKRIEQLKEINDLGITMEDIDSKEFKDFSKYLDPSMSLKEKYEFYQKIKPKEKIESIGSMKNESPSVVKDFYTQEEIAQLSEDDLDDPKVWNAVRNSMTKGR